jgi:molecular chaperone DnaK
MSKIVGIDLGTTNSLVAVLEGGEPVVITASTNLNKADIERMVQDAQRSASEDNRRRETVQARNEADQAIYQAEKSLRDLGEKVSASDRGKLEAQMNTLKETMPSEDAGRIRVQIAELQQAMMVLGIEYFHQEQENGYFDESGTRTVNA